MEIENVYNKKWGEFMNKRRRIKKIVFVLLMLSVFAISGCGNKKKQVGAEEDNAIVKEEEQEEEKKEYKFGFSCIAKENPYYVTLGDSIREALAEEGYTVLGLNEDTNLDPELQNEQIQQMIEEGIDAIFLAPVDWQAITPALEALREADVKIINVDTQVAELDYVDAYIGSDNKNAGVQCGENLVQRFPEGGKIAILECPTMNSINERISGFEETVTGHPFEVVAREDVAGDLSKARDAVKKILEKNPDLTAIMCGNDQSAVGACVAANEIGNKTVGIYGVDGSPEIKKELEKNSTQVIATAAQSPIQMGKEAVRVAMSVLEGEPFEKETYLETYLITKDNVEMYGSDGWQ